MSDSTRDWPVRVLRILWPAFLMAGVAEMLVFTVVDPNELRWFNQDPIQWSLMTIYSVTFLIFWGVISTASAMTQLLASPAEAAAADHAKRAQPV